MYAQQELAPAGSTGNQTFAGVNVPDGGHEALAFQFVVETVGASPSVTWKVQGSPDDPALVDDANANWYDVGYVTDATDTISTAARVRTTVGGDIAFLANPLARRYQRYRLVVSGASNIVYHADMFRISAR